MDEIEIAIGEYPFTSAIYPGKRPRFSFFLTGTGILRLSLRNLDKILEDRGLIPASERYAVLAYGSNACPGQLVDKGLSDVPVIFGRMHGAEAVYAKRKTQQTGCVPATIARKRGNRPSWITLLTVEQLQIMDTSEGRRYNTYVLAELPKVKFFVGQKHFSPLYTYVNIRGGVMMIKGRPVSLHSAAQKRATALLEKSKEKDAASLLDFNVISSPKPPASYSRLIGRRRGKR